MDRICSRDCVIRKLDRERIARIGVWFIEGRTSAGNRNTNAMPTIENLTEPANMKRNLIYSSRFHEDFLVKPLSITGSLHVVDNQYRATIRINVAYTHDEIGVPGR